LKELKKSKIIFKAGILTIFLILTSFTNFAIARSPISSAEQALDYLMENIPIDYDEVLLYIWGPLPEGQDVFTTKDFVMKTPDSGFVFYIDLYPLANSFHPVKYIFLSELKGEFIIEDTECPPLNYEDYQLIETEMGELFLSAKNRIAPIPENDNNPVINEKSDKRWAVLMNGGHSSGSNHIRYWNDLSNIYITLNHVYGYPDENIIVLCSDGLDEAPDQSNGQNSPPDLDNDGDDDIMYSCVLSNVDMVFEELANTLTQGSELFVFTTDHGSSNGGWNTLFNLWNAEELLDSHFAELLDALPNCEIICTFEPCFSGGFLDDVVVPPGPRVASSACRHDEYSWAMSNLEYDEYVFHWTAAVKGEDAYGEPVDADFNEDGFITMDEAYQYAVEHDEASESPQYGDYPEGIGAEFTLWPGSDPPETPEIPQGPDEWIQYVDTTFSSTTTDPEGDSIYFMFDWGDGSDSGWVGPYGSGQTGEAAHNWSELGDYEIKVIAKDENDIESNWSESTTLTIVENEPPDAPIITGPSVAKVKRLISFKFSTTDYENHEVYFYISWGDGEYLAWEGPFSSGEEIEFGHAYQETGDYTIVARAMDQYAARSIQSNFNLKISTDRGTSNIFNLRFVEFLRHNLPNIYLLLRYIITIQ
jgi:hypothetical protein